MASPYRVALVTAPPGRAAERLARGLVEAGLAACVNVVPRVSSHYRWAGKLRRDAESLLLLKTRASKLAAARRWIEAHHPYDVPEFVALPIESGSPAYLAWLGSCTR